MRLRRSIIWCNGVAVEEAKKAITGPGDAVCLDLEDGVAELLKPQARQGTLELLHQDFKGKERIIRINQIGSADYQLDMREVISRGLPDAIRIPKCEYPQDILKVDAELTIIEAANGLKPNSIEILELLETPMGIRNAYELAACCPRVTSVGIGTEDLTRSMGIKRLYGENDLYLLYARQKVVMDAKAAGVQINDAVLLMSTGEELWKRQAIFSKQQGFTGCSCRDSAEALLANEIYGPDLEDVKWSRGVVAAYEQGLRENTAKTYFLGTEICLSAYEKARDTVAYAEEIAAKEALCNIY